MVQLIANFLKVFFFPGTLTFAVVVGVTFLALARRGGTGRHVGTAGFAILVASYFVLALPETAARLSCPLRQFDLLDVDARTGRLTAIVFLAGDSAHARVLETLRLAQSLQGIPIVVSGSDQIRSELIAGGASESRIVMDSVSRTTREQALNVAQIIKARSLGRVVLVASVIQMPRALAAFRAVGVDAVPSATPSRRIMGLARFWPAEDGLRLSRESLYEHAALAYYRSRGWIHGSPAD